MQREDQENILIFFSPGGEIGRHARLKILWNFFRMGSTPILGIGFFKLF